MPGIELVTFLLLFYIQLKMLKPTIKVKISLHNIEQSRKTLFKAMVKGEGRELTLNSAPLRQMWEGF